jgi:hypothetical protein
MTAERRRGREVEIEPCEELELLALRPPKRADSAEVWLAWHERHIACWERIAREHSFMTDNATYMAEGHRRKVTALRADPDDESARRGYWDLGRTLT